MSLEVETRLAQQMTTPYVDPYGNPIPGLAALGIDETRTTGEGKEGVGASQELRGAVADGESLEFRLDRIGERLQSDVELLGELARHGILPGARLQVERVGDSLVARGPEGGEVALTDVDADQLHVTAVTGG
jgi:DtxR family Mn-dependent transcriptional regulator